MFQRFDDAARQVIVLAQEEARGPLRHSYIGTEHLLLGLLRGGGIAGSVLEDLGVHLEDTREAVRSIVGTGVDEPRGQIPFTPRSKRVLESALRESLSLHHSHIGPEHLLLALLAVSDGVAVAVLRDVGLRPDSIRQRVLDTIALIETGPEAAARRATQLRARLALVEALLAACERRAEVVDLIATSPNPRQAAAGLMELLGISEENARQVLALRLERMTAEGERLRHECEMLRCRLREADEDDGQDRG